MFSSYPAHVRYSYRLVAAAPPPLRWAAPLAFICEPLLRAHQKNPALSYSPTSPPAVDDQCFQVWARAMSRRYKGCSAPDVGDQCIRFWPSGMSNGRSVPLDRISRNAKYSSASVSHRFAIFSHSALTVESAKSACSRARVAWRRYSHSHSIVRSPKPLAEPDIKFINEV